MLKATLASLRAHSARLVFSSLAIVLGVGFAAGTFALTDTIQRGYESSFAADARRLDVVATRDGSDAATPADLAETVRDVEGVQAAAVRYTGYGKLLDKEGRLAGGGQGFARVDSVAPVESLQWQQVVSGRLASAPDEVTLDRSSAKRFGYSVGDTVRLLDVDDDVRSYELVGTVDMSGSPQYAGSPYAGVTAAQAKRLVGVDTKVRVDVLAADGSDRATVKANVDAALPSGWTTYTSAQYTERQLKDIASELAQLRIGLLAFAGIAMFVAAIVIANTFTILVAQRVREMALLRCVGATRGQVYRSVLAESLVLGLVGSALGLLAGIGLAAAAQAVLRTVDAPVPEGPVSPTVVGMVVPFVLGTVVTVAAAALPAVGATRIAPVAALRNQPGIGKARKSHRVRTVLALLAVLGGCGAMTPGVLGDGGETEFLLALGGGALTFLGVLFLTPFVVPRLIGLVGWVFATPFRTPGKLARANAVRNPGRAAATSAALLVGVTLISIMAVVSSSVQKTATAGLEEEFPYDLVVSGRGSAVPESVLQQLDGEDELSGVVSVRTAQGRIGGSDEILVEGVDRQALARELGQLKTYAKAADGKVVVPKYLAVRQHLSVGDEVTVRFGGGKTLTAEVAGTVTGEKVIATEHDLRAAVPSAAVGSVFLVAKSGAAAEDVQLAVDDALAGHPELTAEGPLQYRAALEKGLETTLLLFAGLVGVAVLIALVGIANTLALSVLERTRESGVLRALGLTRRQLRGMFSGEAALMAAVAGVLGVALGVGFGYVAITSLLGRADAVLVVPYGRLAAFVGVAALAGLVASLLPARKAARSSVVAAMAEE